MMTDFERIQFLREQFPEGGFFQDKEWLLSSQAFALSEAEVAVLENLGPALRHFQLACNDLYQLAVHEPQWSWVCELLDAGKPAEVVALGRSGGWRADLPRVIRPDLLLTARGFSIAELDSLPGGMGLTAWLGETYAAMGDAVLGGAHGMVEGFKRAFPNEWILMSEESADYAPEMRWLAERLGDGRRVLRPSEVEPQVLKGKAAYRFFELFDLANVEGSEAVLELAQRGELMLTPPLKAYLEEKLWLALFWAPTLEDYWRSRLKPEEWDLLRACIPQGWIVDPAPLPPFAELAGLGVGSWDEVMAFGRRERELVLKISGFSPLGWGSRGVSIGHDMSGGEWRAALEAALAGYAQSPHLMQRFAATRVVHHPAWDEVTKLERLMPSRVRLCPYYFVSGRAETEEVRLGGVLATVCPADKKLLHGMRDAMMLPAVKKSA